MKKLYQFALVMIAFIITSIYFYLYDIKYDGYVVGIIKCASFPPIDEAVKNFTDTLKELSKHKRVKFITLNAENSAVNAHIIAQKFANNKEINAFFTTDTVTTQALSSLEKKRPIVFMAVENPKEIALLEKGTNVCGITDRIPPAAARELLELIKNSKEQIIGLLAKNETSRKALLMEVMKELKDHGHRVMVFTPLNEMELLEQLESIMTKVDILFAPVPDSMIGATLSVIAKEAQQKNIPFLVALEHGAALGALASRGTNYPKNGSAAAEMIYEILDRKKKPYEFSLQPGGYDTVYINKTVLSLFGEDKIGWPQSCTNIIFV